MVTEFELAILKIVSSFYDGINWYGVAMRLSDMDLPERPHQIETQDKLVDMGLLKVDSERRVWQITDLGLELISQQDSESK